VQTEITIDSYLLLSSIHLDNQLMLNKRHKSLFRCCSTEDDQGKGCKPKGRGEAI